MWGEHGTAARNSLHRTDRCQPDSARQLRCDSAAKLLSAVWQSRRLYLAPAELLSRRKRGCFLSGGPARARLSLLELPVESESVWARVRDFCFDLGCVVDLRCAVTVWCRLYRSVPGGAGVGREAAPLEQLIRGVSCCKAQVVGLLLVFANDEPSSSGCSAIALPRTHRAQGRLSERGVRGSCSEQRSKHVAALAASH